MIHRSCIRCQATLSQRSRRFCDRHYTLHRATVQRRERKQKVQGLCVACTQPAITGIIYCRHHAQKKANLRRIKRPTKKPRLTRWNPETPRQVLSFVKKYNPYLQRDWKTAEPFIREHYELWMMQYDKVLYKSVPLCELMLPENQLHLMTEGYNAIEASS